MLAVAIDWRSIASAFIAAACEPTSAAVAAADGEAGATPAGTAAGCRSFPFEAAALIDFTVDSGMSAASGAKDALAGRASSVAVSAASTAMSVSRPCATHVPMPTLEAGSTADAAARASASASAIASEPTAAGAAHTVVDSTAAITPSSAAQVTPSATHGAISSSAGATVAMPAGAATAAVSAVVGACLPDAAVTAAPCDGAADAIIDSRAVPGAAAAPVAPASAVHCAALASIERSVSCTLAAGAMRSAGFSFHA
ncbi:hypothetical protein I6G56_06670 [Burkholderia humptydooensis]|uniref:Uncharacterized protein n=1 Tax=Burkholderia humptydooensis TaxID=430531 RepID=A0A7T2U3D2_9BURK|nr:hypothetical protein I6G56_06670 [Burkholderia humptydooensis]